jgi:hypothetical protein
MDGVGERQVGLRTVALPTISCRDSYRYSHRHCNAFLVKQGATLLGLVDRLRNAAGEGGIVAVSEFEQRKRDTKGAKKHPLCVMPSFYTHVWYDTLRCTMRYEASPTSTVSIEMQRPSCAVRVFASS